MAHLGKLGRSILQTCRTSVLSSPLRQQSAAPITPALFLIHDRGMASSKLFIGGLSWGTDEKTLRDAFESFGEVTYAKIVTDRDTGRSKGFGFVSFNSDAEAQVALQEMHGRDLAGKTIRVDYATEKPFEGSFGVAFQRGGGYGSRGSSGGSS